MEPLELPRVHIMVSHLVDWRAQPAPAPNPQLLRELKRARGRQTANSRKKQEFITGMSAYRPSAEEVDARRRYIDEWHARMDES